MGKLSKLLRVATVIARRPRSLNKVLKHRHAWELEVARLGFHEGLPQVDILDLCPDLDERISPHSFLSTSSPPVDMALLKALARRFKDCRYLEFGTSRGESVANVASVAAHCTTINLSDAQLRQRGFSERAVAIQRHFSKDLPNVTHIQADSTTFDFDTLGERYDLIFVDGDHTYDGVVRDTATAFRLLKDDRSVIVWHDYGDNPEHVRWDVVKAILDGTPPDQRRHLYRVSNTLCAIYTTEPVASVTARYPQVPTAHFDITIKARKVR